MRQSTSTGWRYATFGRHCHTCTAASDLASSADVASSRLQRRATYVQPTSIGEGTPTRARAHTQHRERCHVCSLAPRSRHHVHQHTRVLDDSSGDCASLLLSPRQQHTTLANEGVVPFWQSSDELLRVGQSCGVDYLLVRRIPLAIPGEATRQTIIARSRHSTQLGRQTCATPT